MGLPAQLTRPRPRAMHLLPLHSTDEHLLRFVDGWVDDLVRGDYAAAFAKTEHYPYYAWTPQLIREVIAGFGHPDPAGTSRVTSRESASGTQHYREIDRESVPEGGVGLILYDLPIDGAWSDVTATFHMLASSKRLTLVLHGIHLF